MELPSSLGAYTEKQITTNRHDIEIRSKNRDKKSL